MKKRNLIFFLDIILIVLFFSISLVYSAELSPSSAIPTPGQAIPIPGSKTKVCIPGPMVPVENIKIVTCDEFQKKLILAPQKKLCGIWARSEDGKKITEKADCGSCPSGFQCVNTNSKTNMKIIVDTNKLGGFCESREGIQELKQPCGVYQEKVNSLVNGKWITQTKVINAGSCKNCLRCEWTGFSVGPTPSLILIPGINPQLPKEAGRCYLALNGQECALPNGQSGICQISDINNMKCVSGACTSIADCPNPHKGKYCVKKNENGQDIIRNGQKVDAIAFQYHSYICSSNGKCIENIKYDTGFLAITADRNACRINEECVYFPNFADEKSPEPNPKCVTIKSKVFSPYK